MKEFCYLNFSTKYSCKGKIYVPFKTDYCFSQVFHNIGTGIVSNTYTVKFYQDIKYLLRYHKNNMCFMDNDTIARHLEEIRKVYKFDYEIKSIKGKYPKVMVILKLEDLPATFHKFALTWLRYVYEYPHNVLLLDAYRLKKELQNKSVISIINSIGNTVAHRSIHSLTDQNIYKSLSFQRLRDRIRQVSELHELYTKVRDITGDDYLPEFGKFNCRDLEYWQSDACFEKIRKPLYLKLLKR